MDNDPLQPPSPQPDLTGLQAKYDALHQLVVSILLIMVIVTGTFWIFLMRQVRTAGADLAVYRAQTTNLVAQLKPNEPLMDDLLRRFQDFGRTNADFVPYLAKYGIVPTNRPTATAPAPAPTKKKQ